MITQAAAAAIAASYVADDIAWTPTGLQSQSLPGSQAGPVPDCAATAPRPFAQRPYLAPAVSRRSYNPAADLAPPPDPKPASKPGAATPRNNRAVQGAAGRVQGPAALGVK